MTGRGPCSAMRLSICERNYASPGRIQQLAFSKADSRYLIADSSKIGKRDFYTFCRLDNLDVVVCEPGITAEDRAAIEEHAQVIC